MNKELPKRKSNRLSGYDYSQAGYYFITICTYKQIHYFGKIIDGKVKLNKAGNLVKRCWSDTPGHYDYIELDEYVIMPNHIHAIVIIRTGQGPVPTRCHNNYGMISKVVNAFKGRVTKYLRQEFNYRGFAWQRSFYDHIIRNEKALNEIRKYMIENPLKWHQDEYYRR